MNKELKITKGEWRVDDSGYLSKGGGICIMNDNECVAVVGDYNPHQPIKYNAELIADAGNTIQSCGLLPSELLKQNKEMREILQNKIGLSAVESIIDEFIENTNTVDDEDVIRSRKKEAKQALSLLRNIKQFLTPKN